VSNEVDDDAAKREAAGCVLTMATPRDVIARACPKLLDGVGVLSDVEALTAIPAAFSIDRILGDRITHARQRKRWSTGTRLAMFAFTCCLTSLFLDVY
jgi:hypothetical protein